MLAQATGEVVMIGSRSALEGFAVCMTGPGSEGGAKTCYVKFAAVRGGKSAPARFDRLLGAIDAFASARGTNVEAGVSLARRAAYARMRVHGYKATTLGVTMHRPHANGLHQPHVYAITDLR